MATAPNPRDRSPERGPQEPDRPRIVEERRIVGPYGEEEHEVIDQYGRRFWSFRPVPRERYDMWGFGWFWWLIVWLIVIGLIVWGWGWGY